MATRTLVVRPPLTPKSVFWWCNDDVERCSTRCCINFWVLKNGHFRGFPGPDKVSGPGKSAQNRFFDVFRRQRCNSSRLMCLHHKICSCTTNFTLSTQRERVAQTSKKGHFWPLFRPPKNTPKMTLFSSVISWRFPCLLVVLSHLSRLRSFFKLALVTSDVKTSSCLVSVSAPKFPCSQNPNSKLLLVT